MRATNSPRPVPSGTPLAGLRDSWTLSLEARNLSPKTIRTYRDAVNDLLRHLEATDGPDAPEDLRRRHIEGLLVAMRERGLSASMLSLTYRALQQWMKWMVGEEEIETSPMAGMSAPIVPDIPVPIVPEGDLKNLLAVCAGRDFVSRRDTAMIRMFLDTGGRLSEVALLKIDDVSLGRDANLARVLGKGRRSRDLPFGAKTAQALDRYQRVRARHRYAHLDALWLGISGGPMTASGLYQVIRRRARQAGLPPMHPHQLRHTFAHSWQVRNVASDATFDSFCDCAVAARLAPAWSAGALSFQPPDLL